MVKFLQEWKGWNGHQPDNCQYLDELLVQILMKRGISKSVNGTMPQRPHNFIMDK
jgi:hypothetical protein